MEASPRVVVIGSGPAGAAAVHFLSESGVAVTLVEAGAEHAARGLTVRIGGFTIARWGRPLTKRESGFNITGSASTVFYEDLAPGGLSNHWSLAVPRFSQEDFADAARAGEAFAWPVDYAALAPWYDRVEPLLAVSGAADDVARVPAGKVAHIRRLAPSWRSVVGEANRCDRDVIPVPYAYGSSTTVTRSGTAFNAFVRLVEPAIRKGGVKVRYDARALRLEYDPSRRRVTAVIIRNRRTGMDERLPCRAVVIAAGAVNTAQILLQSATDEFPNGLGNSYDVLGRYLHDHPLAKLVVSLGKPISIYPPAYVSRSKLAGAPPLYAAACAQWTSVPLLAKSILRGRPGRVWQTGFNIFGTMAPTPANFVAVNRGAMSEDGSGALSIHIRHPPESEAALEAARDDLVGMLARSGFAPRVDLWHVEPPGEAKHFGGTCRMHASDRFGMLDEWSRLHAVPNVVVADSSAFTTGPEKNPVLTAMALAARASCALAGALHAGGS